MKDKTHFFDEERATGRVGPGKKDMGAQKKSKGLKKGRVLKKGKDIKKRGGG